MFEIVNEIYFKVLVWKIIIPIRIYYIIVNCVLVAVDFPAGSFAKISDFFPGDLSKWNLGENFGFVKFKIFEWKLVFPLIFADDFFEMFHSRIFWNCVGGISFSDKLGGIAGDFIFGVRHFFFFFLGKKIPLQILPEWGKLRRWGGIFFDEIR